MSDLDSSKKGNVAYNYYKNVLQSEEVIEKYGINLAPEQILEYYQAGHSILDVIRWEDPENRIEEGELIIKWKDKHGEGEKIFYKSPDSRKYLEKADKLRKYLVDRR